MKRLSWAVQAALFYLFTLSISRIPASIIPRAGRLTGLLLHRLLSARRRIAIDNIRQTLAFMQQNPDWNSTMQTAEEIARETFIHLGTSLLETCCLYHGKGGDLINAIEIRGLENYESARIQGKGLVFITGHCGNWELGALGFSHTINAPVAVVARRQDNPYLNTMVEKMRVQYQNQIIYKDKAMRAMLAVIRKKAIVGLLLDQAVSPEDGVLIPFLGRMAWASKVPVILARKTGVVVLPVFTHREGTKHVITINPQCVFTGDDSDEGLAADVRHYSGYIERTIIAHPADWYWVHRRWKRAGEQAG